MGGSCGWFSLMSREGSDSEMEVVSVVWVLRYFLLVSSGVVFWEGNKFLLI